MSASNKGKRTQDRFQDIPGLDWSLWIKSETLSNGLCVHRVAQLRTLYATYCDLANIDVKYIPQRNAAEQELRKVVYQSAHPFNQ